MNVKVFLAIQTLLLLARSGYAQTSEAADSLARELQEVVVSAKQPATKLVGTTIVSTVAGTNLADLGTALDVLAQLPMIKVTDGVVDVLGRSNVEIYIDGRPMRNENELQQLLSGDMKSVELLMAPGAAYASTTGAVLKITTRRRLLQGLSLTDRFRFQRRRKWSVMDYLSLGYRIGNCEFFADGTFNRNHSLITGSTVNTLTYDGRRTEVGSSQRNSYPSTVGVVRAGFNYAKGAQSFGGYYRYNPERADFSNSGREWFDDAASLVRQIDRRVRAHGHLVSVYYENKFADKYLLHFDGDFRRAHDDEGVTTAYPDSDNAAVCSTAGRASTLWAGKLYVNVPLWNGDFTFGTQDSHTHTRLDYRMLNAEVGEYIPSALTDARQTSAALFASWSRRFGRLSLSAGARYEFTDYDFKVNGLRDDDASRRDHLLTPDISLGYSFNDYSQVSLAYKMTTVKPPYAQLTGSLNYTGLHEIEGGNPALRDERMHDVRLMGMWRGFMLQADYVRSADSYAFVKQPYPADNLQLLMHPVNIDVSALSLCLVWGRPVGLWTPNVTAGLYRQWLRLGNNRYDKPIFSYYFDNVFALPRGWQITANVNGSSQGDMHTNRFGASWFTMDMSVGKTFLNKALTVSLSATDVFNTANNGWTMNTFGVFVDKCVSYDRRGLSLSIIYNFRPRKSGYRGADAAEAEAKRL